MYGVYGADDMKRQKPNVERMRLLGAEVRAAKTGSMTLKDATNEAMRFWIANPTNTHYVIGSAVGPHPYPMMVAEFHRIIGEETMTACARLDLKPTHLVACLGGGSNALGLFLPYIDQDIALVGVEAGGEGLDSGRTAPQLKRAVPAFCTARRPWFFKTAKGRSKRRIVSVRVLIIPALVHCTLILLLLEDSKLRCLGYRSPEGGDVVHSTGGFFLHLKPPTPGMDPQSRMERGRIGSSQSQWSR